MSQLLQFYKSFQQSKAPVAKAAPTFEDLTIDDNLTEQQRLIRYAKSTIGLQRLVHVKMMADVASSIGFEETVRTIVPLIEPLSKDSESVVKQHLVEQLRYLAKFCQDNGDEEGYRVVLDQILPVTANLLEDEKAEVRQSASMTLVEVAQLVRYEDIGQHVLTIILRLAHEDDKEEMRMTASQLLNLLAECLGQDLCKQFVIPEVVSLSEDPVFRVRKSTALNFHNICKVGGEFELLERLMPAFVRLSKDDMYRVRRACAESLSEIAKNVSEDIRLGVLVEIFLRLTHDPSKLVKQSILQQSGVFIATLPARAVTDTILNQYCSMVAAPTGDISVDNELRHICAYSFPAVLQAIGPERWHEVRDVYHNLAQSRSSNIKQTLAYSLHEIARILDDGNVVEEELVPVFEDMIQDVEVVQMGVIKYLAKFLAKLPEPCRLSYLPLLHDILHSTNPFNWRLRQHLARQLPDLVMLPPKKDIYRTLFPTVMILLQDPVASVRGDTFAGVTALINELTELVDAEVNLKDSAAIDHEAASTYQQNVDDVVKALNSFVTAEKFQQRQLWIDLCAQLLRDLPRPFFEEHFIPGILHLTLDPVCNVRVALSHFLVAWGYDYLPPWEMVDHNGDVVDVTSSNDRDINSDVLSDCPPTIDEKVPTEGEGSIIVPNNQSKAACLIPPPTNDAKTKLISPWHWLLRRTDIRVCVVRLSCDDNDVYVNIRRLQPLYPDLVFSSVSCRGRKTPPGGINPIEIDPTPISLALTSNLINALSGGQRMPKVPSSGDVISTLGSGYESSGQLSAFDNEASSTMREDHIRLDSSSSIASSVDANEEEEFASPASSVRSRSRGGSITTSEIHLETVDISPVEIDNNTPVITSRNKTPPASFIIPTVIDLKDLKSTGSPLSGPGGIVADELDLIDGFALPTPEEVEEGPVNPIESSKSSVADDEEDKLVDEEADAIPYEEPEVAKAEFLEFKAASSDTSDTDKKSLDGDHVFASDSFKDGNDNSMINEVNNQGNNNNNDSIANKSDEFRD